MPKYIIAAIFAAIISAATYIYFTGIEDEPQGPLHRNAEKDALHSLHEKALATLQPKDYQEYTFDDVNAGIFVSDFVIEDETLHIMDIFDGTILSFNVESFEQTGRIDFEPVENCLSSFRLYDDSFIITHSTHISKISNNETIVLQNPNSETDFMQFADAFIAVGAPEFQAKAQLYDQGFGHLESTSSFTYPMPGYIENSDNLKSLFLSGLRFAESTDYIAIFNHYWPTILLINRHDSREQQAITIDALQKIETFSAQDQYPGFYRRVISDVCLTEDALYVLSYFDSESALIKLEPPYTEHTLLNIQQPGIYTSHLQITEEANSISVYTAQRQKGINQWFLGKFVFEKHH